MPHRACTFALLLAGAVSLNAWAARPTVYLALSPALEKELLPLLKEKELAGFHLVPLSNSSFPQALARVKGEEGARLFTDLSLQNAPAGNEGQVVSLWPGEGVRSLVDPSNELAAVAKALGKPSKITVSAAQGAVANAAAVALRRKAASLQAEGGPAWEVEIVAAEIPWPAPVKGKTFVRLSFAEKPKPPKHVGHVLVPLLDPGLGSCRPVALYLKMAKKGRRPVDPGAVAFLAELARKTPASEPVFFKGPEKLGGSSYMVSCR